MNNIMTIQNYNTAKNLRKRIEELEEILKMGGTLNLTGNTQDSKKVYITAQFINSESRLLEDIKAAIIKEIKALEDKFNSL